MQQKIALLDYANGRVIIRDVKRANEDTAEAIAKDEGVRLKDCEWMGGALTVEIE